MDRTFEIDVATPPDEVFAWLYEPDKVRQWTSGLEAYEVQGGGAIGAGTKIRETLEVSGSRRSFEEEIVAYDPPSAAASRFSLEGIAVESSFRVTPNGAGSHISRTVKAKAEKLSARFLLPIVQPHLERKLQSDFEALRALLA
jgi:carbon monoxide dehydrogenase subunit G